MKIILHKKWQFYVVVILGVAVFVVTFWICRWFDSTFVS